MNTVITASGGEGLVVLVLDPASAVDFADAWELAQSSGALVRARPEFLLDSLAIRRAAIAATIDAQHAPTYVPLKRDRRLYAVSGDL